MHLSTESTPLVSTATFSYQPFVVLEAGIDGFIQRGCGQREQEVVRGLEQVSQTLSRIPVRVAAQRPPKHTHRAAVGAGFAVKVSKGVGQLRRGDEWSVIGRGGCHESLCADG